MSTYREVLQPILSPAALTLLERLTPLICMLYELERLLETEVPMVEHQRLRARVTGRLKQIVTLLPPDVPATANEVFTAIEVLVMDVLGRELRVSEEIARLEALSEAFHTDPLLYQLARGQVN